MWCRKFYTRLVWDMFVYRISRWIACRWSPSRSARVACGSPFVCLMFHSFILHLKRHALFWAMTWHPVGLEPKNERYTLDRNGVSFTDTWQHVSCQLKPAGTNVSSIFDGGIIGQQVASITQVIQIRQPETKRSHFVILVRRLPSLTD